MATKSESSIVAKCASVLDIISVARRPLGFKDIIDQSGMARSSTHRILAVLISENLIDYDKANKIYRYGFRLNRWARGAWMSIDLHESSAIVTASCRPNSRHPANKCAFAYHARRAQKWCSIFDYQRASPQLDRPQDRLA